ncbi:MAG: hypothetical protein Q9214_004280 [Letrouitia sp. 1 TL-2023]
MKPRVFNHVNNISRLRELRKEEWHAGLRVGFVPTMGALHEGHITLIRQAVKENNNVVVSIYVNPTQFGVNEDLSSYPKTLESDLEQIRRICLECLKDSSVGQVTTVFTPTTDAMYPNLKPTSEIEGHGSFVTITPLASMLEGASRPVFFRGVATVCMKLFNIVQPDNVYFGQKDVQQTYVIRRMVEDFHLNTQVHVVPTVRESNGLAMSSRNVYLGERRLAVATVFIRSLQEAEQAFKRGKHRRLDLLDAFNKVFVSEQEKQRALPKSRRAMFDVDYISLADPRDLTELDQVRPEIGAIMSGAFKMMPIEDPQDGEKTGLGGDKTTVRLIDNLRLNPISPSGVQHSNVLSDLD